MSSRDTLIVAFLDVGQGDSIFIEAPNGNQVLIDAGRDRKVLRELSKLMPFYDRSIDVVIGTHPDEDHIGGIPDVLKRFQVGLYLDSGNEKVSNTSESVYKILRARNIEYEAIDSRLMIDLDEGVFLEILFPVSPAKNFGSNTASVIARLVYEDHQFLFTGDSPKVIERYLTAAYGEKLESEVFKVGHHGSKTSSHESFLNVVSPQYSIVSAGHDNRYGHPHEEIIERLEALPTKILYTWDGTIVFESDGKLLIKK